MSILGYFIGAPVMMQLGNYQFGISTAAYQALQRTTEWRWPAQELFGQRPVLQRTGPGQDTIRLQGVIYPEWRGGVGQLDAMRAAADKAQPMNLVDGRGNALGRWVVERVEEGQSVFADAGVPRKQEFTLSLRRFPDAAQDDSLLGAVSSAAGAAGVAVPANATGPVAQLSGLAKSVADGAKTVAATVNQAYHDVQQAVAPYAAVAKDAIGGVLRCAQVASELQTTANRALAIVGKRPIDITAISAAQTMANKAGGLLVTATSAGALLRSTTAKLEQLGTVPANAVQAVRSAAVAADKTAMLCRQTAAEAGKIKE